jgi:hypothetical protein
MEFRVRVSKTLPSVEGVRLLPLHLYKRSLHETGGKEYPQFSKEYRRHLFCFVKVLVSRSPRPQLVWGDKEVLQGVFREGFRCLFVKDFDSDLPQFPVASRQTTSDAVYDNLKQGVRGRALGLYEDFVGKIHEADFFDALLSLESITLKLPATLKQAVGKCIHSIIPPAVYRWFVFCQAEATIIRIHFVFRCLVQREYARALDLEGGFHHYANQAFVSQEHLAAQAIQKVLKHDLFTALEEISSALKIQLHRELDYVYEKRKAWYNSAKEKDNSGECMLAQYRSFFLFLGQEYIGINFATQKSKLSGFVDDIFSRQFASLGDMENSQKTSINLKKPGLLAVLLCHGVVPDEETKGRLACYLASSPGVSV